MLVVASIGVKLNQYLIKRVLDKRADWNEYAQTTPLKVPGVVGDGDFSDPEEFLRQAVAHGINKINFGTELKDALAWAVKTRLAGTDEIDLRKTCTIWPLTLETGDIHEFHRPRLDHRCRVPHRLRKRRCDWGGVLG